MGICLEPLSNGSTRPGEPCGRNLPCRWHSHIEDAITDDGPYIDEEKIVKETKAALLKDPALSLTEIAQVASHRALTEPDSEEQSRNLRIALAAQQRIADVSGEISVGDYRRRVSWARKWSKEQLEARQLIRDGRRNIALIGSTGSGKSDGGIADWMDVIANNPDVVHGLVVRGEAGLGRMMRLLEDWAHELWWSVTKRKDHIQVGPARIEWGIGVHDRSHELIKGATWYSVFVDEANELPKRVLDEIAARAREGHGPIIMTANGNEPTHWFTTDIKDKIRSGELDGGIVQYNLENAHWLEPDFIEDLKARYQGPLYSWYVLGEDAALSGLVYPLMDQAVQAAPKPKTEKPFGFWLTGDVGYSESATHFLLIGQYSKGRYWVLDEWRHCGAETGQPISYAEQPGLVLEWALPIIGERPCEIMVDQAEAQWKRELSRTLEKMKKDLKGKVRIVDADKRQIMPGIRAVQSLTRPDGGKVRIVPEKCEVALRELRGLRWNPKRADKGDEYPTIGPDHGADALRYWCDALENRSHQPYRA